MICPFLSCPWPIPIHFSSPRHVGLFTSTDSLTLISDLTSWLIPLTVTRHGLWLILYGLAYIRSSMYPPYSLALSSPLSCNPLDSSHPLSILGRWDLIWSHWTIEPLNPWTHRYLALMSGSVSLQGHNSVTRSQCRWIPSNWSDPSGFGSPWGTFNASFWWWSHANWDVCGTFSRHLSSLLHKQVHWLSCFRDYLSIEIEAST